MLYMALLDFSHRAAVAVSSPSSHSDQKVDMKNRNMLHRLHHLSRVIECIHNFALPSLLLRPSITLALLLFATKLVHVCKSTNASMINSEQCCPSRTPLHCYRTTAISSSNICHEEPNAAPRSRRRGRRACVVVIASASKGRMFTFGCKSFGIDFRTVRSMCNLFANLIGVRC